MLLFVVLIGLHQSLSDELREGFAYLKPVFWLETLLLLAFAVSWSLKVWSCGKSSGMESRRHQLETHGVLTADRRTTLE
jgi:hypothetical protein